MKPGYIVIHHSLTEDGDTVSWGAIRDYHVQTNGWQDIGYHYGIELIRANYEILMGRFPDEIGAHCREDGMNRRSLGICMVGNFDLLVPPPAQWWKTIRLVTQLCDQYNIPHSKVVAHRDYATYKSCPGKLFDMDKFRSDLG